MKRWVGSGGGQELSEVQEIVALARRARARGEQLCLATVVRIEGSTYRKPGARMLLTSGGQRAGTISGGCLEAEVSRRAWWLSRHGPRVERYSSFSEEGEMPYGLGCGGTVWLLLEQGEPVDAVLAALEHGVSEGHAAAVVCALNGAGLLPDGSPEAETEPGPGTIAVWAASAAGVPPRLLYTRNAALADSMLQTACAALKSQASIYLDSGGERRADGGSGEQPGYSVEYLAPPPALTIFGAGDDAQPLAELAHTLGWRVTVADGRAHLARRDRFPKATEVRVLEYADPALRASCGLTMAAARSTQNGGNGTMVAEPVSRDGLAVILTHSYEQDRALLTSLLPQTLAYLGILGPRHRTERLLAEITPGLGLTLDQALARLHSPVGLDLGAGEPAAVALSIVAEMQAVLHRRRVSVERLPAAGLALQGERAKLAP